MPRIAHADATPMCASFTDCDMAVACELYQQVETALAGNTPNWDQAVVTAILAHPNECTTYPDKFKDSKFSENLKIENDNNKDIQITIDWKVVKEAVKTGRTPDEISADTPPQTSDNLSGDELVAYLVDIFGPDTEAQRVFFEALVKSYIAANKRDATSRLNDAFVINFLGDNNNLEKYKGALITLTGEVKNEDEGIDVNWDDVLDVISEVMDNTNQKRGALVCENNRSWEGAIDIVGWVLTVVAAVATFYSGGAGGAAVAAGRAALGAGLKAAAKGIAKVGGKAAAKKLVKQGSKQLAKAATKKVLGSGFKRYGASAAQKVGTKGMLKAGTKHYIKTVGNNLKKKTTRYLTAGAVLYGVGKNKGAYAKGGTMYSLVSSDADKDIVNCQDLDHNEGCYTVCGDGAGTDDLNTKVFKPILGKTYCVNASDYLLYEMNGSQKTGKPIVFTKAQWDKIISTIKSKVADKGKCDWNEDDIDMYGGYYMYDPDTMEISVDTLVIDAIIRLDD